MGARYSERDSVLRESIRGCTLEHKQSLLPISLLCVRSGLQYTPRWGPADAMTLRSDAFRLAPYRFGFTEGLRF